MADTLHPCPAQPPPPACTPRRDTPWRQLLFLSRLADACGYEVFARLVRLSRLNNAARGIGGCLLFDGQRFCQLIEGPEPAVSALWRRIADDTRHRDVAVLLDRARPAPGQAAAWDYGYCGADDLDAFDPAAACTGLDALAAFEAIRAQADLTR